MIKITYKDYQIETDTVDQARWLMNEIGMRTRTTKGVVDKIQRAKRKYTRSGKYTKVTSNRWTVDEINHLLSRLNLNHDSSDIRRDSMLRIRHKKGAIGQMMYNAKNNRNSSKIVSKEIGDVIREWNENRVVKLEVSHD